jgi:hypothetical protein
MPTPKEIFGKKPIMPPEPPKPTLARLMPDERGICKCPVCEKCWPSIQQVAGHIMGMPKRDTDHKEWKPVASFVLAHRFEGNERLMEIYKNIGGEVTDF